MAGKPTDAGKKFIEGIMKHVPAELQEHAQKIFGIDALVEEVGNGALMHGDYTRQTAQLRADREAVVKWREENEPLVVEAQRVLAANKGRHLADPDYQDPPIPPAIDPDKLRADVGTDVVGRLSKDFNERERGAALFMAKLTNISNKHFREFGEALDTEELVANPRIYEIGLDGAYQEANKPKYDAKAATQRQAEIDAAVGKERERVTAEFQGRQLQMPHPTLGAGALNPVMAALEAGRVEGEKQPDAPGRPFTNRVNVADVASEYHRLVAAGVGAGAE